MSTLKKLSPAFCAVINESARKIFGNLPIVNYRTGFKILKQRPMGPAVTNYHAEDAMRPFRDAFGMKTEQEEERLQKLVRMRRRGKGPPKKGQGKRAQKAKK